MTDHNASPSPPTAAAIRIRAFGLDDYAQAYALWLRTPEVGLSSADRPDAIARFLERNPGLSFAAWCGPRLAGTILCGHDGRRGLIHHLAVDAAERRRGLGRALLERSLDALYNRGIEKCHLLVFSANASGQAFWAAAGAARRTELALYSLPTASGAAASLERSSP